MGSIPIAPTENETNGTKVLAAASLVLTQAGQGSNPCGPTAELEELTNLPGDVEFRSAQKLAAAVLQRAKSQNDCYGRYCLVVRGSPRIPKPTSINGKQLLIAATLFIDLTGTARSHPEETLFSDENGSIAIEKQDWLCGSRVIVEFRS